jgi:2-polyprenyl-3-methyl-5-hydroxy-6-metoxy-1,4-benzoquinol methylase
VTRWLKSDYRENETRRELKYVSRETNAMIRVNKCPVCGSQKMEVFLELKDYFLTGESFEISQCIECGFKFTNPVPRETDLQKYYESDEYISHSNTSKGLINGIYQSVRKHSIKKKVKIATRELARGEALDIGCGTGDFLKEMLNSGWNVKGIEPNNTARNSAIKNYGLDIYNESQLFEFRENSFDVITMWHVLEHVYNLERNIDQMKMILRKEGRLVIALPNADSLDAAIYKNFWAAYDVPRHLYHFNQSSFKRLMGKYGFEIIETKPMVFDSFYISMLSEKFKSGKINYLNAFFNGLKTDIYGLINKKYYSSLIYVLRMKNS